LSGRARAADRVTWKQLLTLGEQLMAQPTFAAQRDLIVQTAARLLGGQADLWLAEPLYRLPGTGEPLSCPKEPPSDLMRRARDSQQMTLSAGAAAGALPVAVAMPLLAGERALGVLEVARAGGPPFATTEIELLDCLIAQVSVALQAARQVAIERWRVTQLSLVSRVSAQVAAILDLDELFRRVTDLILHTFNYYYVALFTLEPGQETLRCRACADAVSSQPGQDHASAVLEIRLGDGIIGHVAQTGEELLANDVSHDPYYRPVDALPETRSEVALPLKVGDRLLGVLDVQSDQPDDFDETDVLVLRALADQIAIAIRNANLYRSERWRSQVADSLREVAGLLSADLALDEVLDAILTELGRTLPCDVAGIWLMHDDDLYLSAVRGYVTEVDVPDFSPDAGPWLTQALGADQPLVRTPSAPSEPLGAALEFAPDYSAIAAPLRAARRRLGILALAHHTPERYGAEARTITAAFASYAAVAIENARLYQAAQEQAWISTVLLQVAEATQSLATLDEVLEAVVRLAPMLAGVDRCALLLWDEPTGMFEPAAAYGIGPAEQAAFDRWRVAPGEVPAFDRLRLDKAPIVSYDVTTDSRLVGVDLSAFGFRALLLLPLLAHGQVVGAMLFDYQSDLAEFEATGAFRGEQITLVQGIAHQTAAAVESARLLQAQQEEAYVSAALLQVAQAVVSLTNLDDVLSTIVRIVPILVGVEWCVVFLWDGEQAAFRPVQAYGVPRRVEATLRTRRYGPGDFTILDTIRERDQVVAYWPEAAPEGAGQGHGLVPPDFAADVGWCPGEATQGGPHALLAVPLSVKGDVLGAMVLEEADAPSRSRERRLDIITGIAHQAALAVQNDRLQREMAERERLEQELQLAHEIQQTFMPRQLPDLPGWELAFAWRAARQVAGDFYDFFELPGGRLGLVIADVADKGMPAALFMALTRTVMRAAALEAMSPAAVLAHVNDLLVPDAHQGMFVTAIYAVLSLDSGELVYVIAGHNLPLWLRSDARELECLDTGGMALGVLEGLQFEEHAVSLKPGDCLVFYTDGITEAFSPQDDIYGEGRLRAAIQAADGSSAQAILDAIDASVAAFTGGAPPSDDQTLMVLRRAK